MKVSIRTRLALFAVAVTFTLTVAPTAGQSVQLVPSKQSEAYSTAIEEARELVGDWLANNNVPGVSVAVVREGAVVWAEGLGLADLEQQVPVTPQTRFRAGSVGKPLTATAVGLLYERGVLDLDAPVTRYVAAFPEKRWPVTMRQLMSHTAGIRHYGSADETLSKVHYDDVLSSLAVFAADTLLFEPGTRYSYSTYGWNLISAIVEAVAEEPFLEFMAREVFEPAGMLQTVPDDVFGIVPNRTRYYDQDGDGQVRNAEYVDLSNKWAGGGFLSTPSDLARYALKMMSGELLDQQTVDLLWTPVELESGQSTNYGLGWNVRNAGGDRLIGHGGRSVGGSASLMIFPEQRMAITLMANMTGVAPARIVIALAKLFAAAD